MISELSFVKLAAAGGECVRGTCPIFVPVAECVIARRTNTTPSPAAAAAAAMILSPHLVMISCHFHPRDKLSASRALIYCRSL